MPLAVWIQQMGVFALFKAKGIRLLFYCAFVFHSVALCAQEGKTEEGMVKFPLPNPSDIGADKFCLLLNTFLKQHGYASWKQDLQPRPTGPFTIHPSGEVESLGTHGSAAVKVCYSPQVWEWMNNGRKELIPDGGMIIKLLYERNPKDPQKFSAVPTGFSIMVKDSKGSWDGWFYSDGGPLQKPVRENADTFFDPNAGFATSCMSCHASADNPEGTYSSIRNVTEPPKIVHRTTISAEGLKKGLTNSPDIHSLPDIEKIPKPTVRKPSPYWDYSDKLATHKEPAPLPLATNDHVPQGPRPNGQRQFITSTNCAACHDAIQLNSAPTNMLVEEKTKSGEKVLANLSPSSEWRYSLMGLSGRDPVFYAQLERERALHPELASQIDNKCMSCHGAMGQRQLKADEGENALFTHKMALAENVGAQAKYGALARDGISCIICHQMSPDDLGSTKSYSGNFKLLDKPTQTFGPYEKVLTLPMQQAIGQTPVLGKHLATSQLCASCHTISLPVLEVGRKYSLKEFAELDRPRDTIPAFHEQATYLEWKNSTFSTEAAIPSPKQQNCQSCHMPQTYKNERLRTRIANIEDDTFPEVDNRAANLHLDVRDTYSRHSLNGINLLVLELFNSNPWLLGVTRKDNLCPGPNVKSGFEVARDAALKMAQEQTATVKLTKVKREKNLLHATVEVENLTGHKFPTGVNFRRAFLELKVQTGDKVLWISGATDQWGVIGKLNGENFVPLKSEFFTDKAYQPHHQTIEREDQVQIYEELVADSNGELTTSFLSLKSVLKDNRLLPQGWSPTGPDAESTHPAGVGEDKDYSNGAGKDSIDYEIPLQVAEGADISVTATLYYQSLPPYYLKRLFEDIEQPAAQRLYYLVNQLDLKDSALANWKLKISSDQKHAE